MQEPGFWVSFLLIMGDATIDKTRDFNMASRKAEEAGQFVISLAKSSLLFLFVFQDVYLMMITNEEKPSI